VLTWLRRRVLDKLLLLDREELAGILTDLAWRKSNRLPSDEALRFLFDLEARIYPRIGDLAVDYGRGVHTKHRHTRYHDFFVERISFGDQVLDIGCGNGALAWDVAERSGATVTAIDLKESNIAHARDKFPHPNVAYRVGDALVEPFQAGFKTVILSNVLEHLPERSDFLQKVVARVGPERFLLRIPLFERDWRVPLKRELGVEWRLDATHETEYTLESFAEEMAAAALEVTHQEVRWGEIWAEARPG